jgi:hypothetical protein
MHNPQRNTTIYKYLAIQKRMDYLYNVKRLRYDDCVEQIMKEFFIEHEATVRRILATEVTEPPPKVDPNQLTIFDELNAVGK